METVVFPQPQVRKALNQFVLVRLYTDDTKNPAASARNVKLQEERFNSAALPFYVVLTPDDRIVGTASFNRDADAFAAFLNEARAKAVASSAVFTPTNNHLAVRP